jgi:CRP/FNR family transcriptional regulator, anaerobic regulatory protein
LESLSQFFTSAGLSATDASAIAEKFIPKKFAKGEYFVREGTVSKYLGFVEKGFLQYFINLDGVEKTTYSVGPNNFAASLVSFLKQVPAKENIRAVMNSELWVLDKQGLSYLLQNFPAFKSFYIELLEWQICCIDESRLDTLILNAQQRYEKMIDKEPALIQQIPLQYLASILGVTPRHLSRIRNKVR